MAVATKALPMMEIFPAAERRSESSALLALVQLVHDDVKQFDEKLTRHMTNETMELAAEISALMQSAFPEGDPLGHRKHHEAVIRAAEAKAIFWTKMRDEILSKGLLGIMGLMLVWAGRALWVAFLQGPGK